MSVMKFYMLICNECNPMLAMPFDSPEERGSWSGKHYKSTGHNTWKVWEEEKASIFIFQPGVGDEISKVDLWLDGDVAQAYKDQPLAQDWARVCKAEEERGETIAELILATGQNPRKERDPEAIDRLIKELADEAWTRILAIQHFTKNHVTTEMVMAKVLEKIMSRVPEEYR